MSHIRIIDLPKYRTQWTYCPPRPTTYVLRRRGQTALTTLRCTLQEPLHLHVGDEFHYDDQSQVPEPLLELTRGYTGHPIYAVITTQGPAPQAGNKRAEYVGQAGRPH